MKRVALVAPVAAATLLLPLAASARSAPTTPTAPAAAVAQAAGFFTRWPVLEVGSAGSDVRTAKYLLRAHGYGVLTDPTYRAATASVVRHFQADRGMTVTGHVGSPTWRALFVSLRAGSSGDAVRGLQYQLWRDGFLGPISGTYDPTTVAAVKRAQTAFALTIDGIAGPATWSALVSQHRPAKVVTVGTTSRKLVALTFDAGSDLGFTNAILDTLARHHIKATFGMTGAWAGAHPIAVRRIVREGHEIVNHTFSHGSLTGFSTGGAALTFAQRRAEVDRAWAVIDAVGGATFTRWFRPPYGDRDASVDRDVAALGYPRELMWTVDSLGWQGIPPRQIVNRVIGAAWPGEIVLMHVGSASTDAAALETVITRLRGLGYGFATASGVMR
jgi:peptidoglycan/xylan/chitin deacetylase (PgdA/CDA1 family)